MRERHWLCKGKCPENWAQIRNGLTLNGFSNSGAISNPALSLLVCVGLFAVKNNAINNNIVIAKTKINLRSFFTHLNIIYPLFFYVLYRKGNFLK
jgi:hypothetical protein